LSVLAATVLAGFAAMLQELRACVARLTEAIEPELRDH